MILPMIGTWVGTVLAFHFGKEQLEAATRSVTSIARELTPDEKLRSIRGTDKMIPRSAAYAVNEDPGKLKLVEAVANLDREKRAIGCPSSAWSIEMGKKSRCGDGELPDSRPRRLQLGIARERPR
jgi:hypothetical protein